MPEVQQVTDKIDFYSPEYQKRVKASLLSMAADINQAAGNGVPVPESKVSEYLDTIQGLIPLPEDRTKPNLTESIREWVLSSDGIFSSSDVIKELNLSSRVIKQASNVLGRLAKESLIAKHGDKRGQWRRIDPGMAPMKWEDCDVSQTVNFTLPLGLHKLMYLYPRNIIVIAGDTNAGKTAYLLNAVRENADNHQIDYFTNDLTPEELKKRVARFAEAGMDTAPFSKCKFIPRTKDFLDVLHPDRITIIDYLALVENVYLVANTLDDIYNRLQNGVCIVAIQKKIGQKLGRGADYAMERPRLYFTLERGKVYIQKMKNLIDAERDPNGKCV
jgi:hypothetical protein